MKIEDLAHLAELRRVKTFASAFVNGKATLDQLQYVTSNVDAPRIASLYQREFDAGKRNFCGINVDDELNVVGIDRVPHDCEARNG